MKNQRARCRLASANREIALAEVSVAHVLPFILLLPKKMEAPENALLISCELFYWVPLLAATGAHRPTGEDRKVKLRDKVDNGIQGSTGGPALFHVYFVEKCIVTNKCSQHEKTTSDAARNSCEAAAERARACAQLSNVRISKRSTATTGASSRIMHV